MDKITDIVASEVNGKKVTTIYIPLEEFMILFEQAFLVTAKTSKDFNVLSRAVQGKPIKENPDTFKLTAFFREPITQDERYHLHCIKASIVNLQKYEISIMDEETGNYYTFKGGFGKEPIQAMEAKIEEYRQKSL